jgi:maleate cis-trans isomerase
VPALIASTMNAQTLSTVQTAVLTFCRANGVAIVGQKFGGEWKRGVGYINGETVYTVRATTLRSLERLGLVTLDTSPDGLLMAR